MAGSFPNISGAYPVRLPYAHALKIPCDVKKFWGGQSQRYAMSGLLNSFKWTWPKITWADLQTVEGFWTTQKGAFDATWSISLADPSDNTVRSYANMAFGDDAFQYTEGPPQWYSLSLSASQAVSEAVTVAIPTNYPTLQGGMVVQVPFGTAPSFKTLKNNLDSGKQISYYAWSSPLNKWSVIYSAITNTELASIVGAYLGAGGSVNSFTFTDPNTSTAHPNCYFGADGLEITRITSGASGCKLTIEEYLS